MELQEMIQELHDARHFVQTTSRSYDLLTAAAEALALVAWAEENVLQVEQFSDNDWRCYTVLSWWSAPTFLGAIRAAKEAYEQQG